MLELIIKKNGYKIRKPYFNVLARVDPSTSYEQRASKRRFAESIIGSLAWLQDGLKGDGSDGKLNVMVDGFLELYEDRILNTLLDWYAKSNNTEHNYKTRTG